MTMSPVTRFEANPKESRTFARQGELPKLPIPPLEETCRRYLRALEGLQDPKEHEETKRAVDDFLQHDGPRVQERLKEYAKDKARCVHASRLSRPRSASAHSAHVYDDVCAEWGPCD